MKLAWRIIAVIAIAGAVACFGCGKAPQANKPTPPRTAIPLPEWAPKNPSPEFLRAAKVLKPMPSEIEQAQSNVVEGGINDALTRRMRLTHTGAWELFGSLSDAQIGIFLRRRELRLSVRSLAPRHRTILDGWFHSWRNLTGAAGGKMIDYQVLLYKLGAKENFSNVDVGFIVGDPAERKGHVVSLSFWVRKADGGTGLITDSCAQL